MEIMAKMMYPVTPIHRGMLSLMKTSSCFRLSTFLLCSSPSAAEISQTCQVSGSGGFSECPMSFCSYLF